VRHGLISVDPPPMFGIASRHNLQQAAGTVLAQPRVRFAGQPQLKHALPRPGRLLQRGTRRLLRTGIVAETSVALLPKPVRRPMVPMAPHLTVQTSLPRARVAPRRLRPPGVSEMAIPTAPAKTGSSSRSSGLVRGSSANRNGVAPRKDARPDTRPARTNRKPALTAGTKVGNSTRFGFSARPKRETKKRG